MARQRHANFKLIIPVSASTGAGIKSLWADLLQSARAQLVPPNGVGPGSEFAVREHVRAAIVRAAQLSHSS
jgi:hypothetical protein